MYIYSCEKIHNEYSITSTNLNLNQCTSLEIKSSVCVDDSELLI